MLRELPAEGLQVRRHRLLPAAAELLRSCDVDAAQAVAFAGQHHVVALTVTKALFMIKQRGEMRLSAQLLASRPPR